MPDQLPETVALITARGGSKRVPGKNGRALGGHPLIAWSIVAALGAARIHRVVVSTDDPTLADISQRYGAEVPFLRPPELASDTASHLDVILHAANFLDGASTPADRICLLQPTSPFRNSAHIDAMIDGADAAATESSVSVALAPHPVYLRHRDENGRVQPVQAAPAGYLRSQDLPPVYRVNGAMYLFSVAGVRRRTTELGPNPYGYVMSDRHSIDIDTEDDFLIAEALVNAGIFSFPDPQTRPG